MENDDFGGVHENSSIINHSFYYLSEGLNGGIGLTNAANIFYRALTLHLGPQSKFLDCRLACVASAKTLFGASSTQAQRTAQAFDAVEIFDSSGAPAPSTNSVVAGDDAALVLKYDSFQGTYFLARRETAKGDPGAGVKLASVAVGRARPAVSGDGQLAAFVNWLHDMCLISTANPGGESSLGYTNQIRAVGMSPDGKHYGFVFQDASGRPENRIWYIDITTGGNANSRIFKLTAPSDAGPVSTIFYAGAISFSPDNRYIVYDALNGLRLDNGTTNGVWSIYAYDLLTSRTLTLCPPLAGLDIGNPSMGHVRNELMVFEAVDQATAKSTVYTTIWSTNAIKQVGTVSGLLAFPSYNPDDTAVFFSQVDSAVPMKTSLMRQTMAADHLTASGAASRWFTNSFYGTVYRRGSYTAPSVPGTCDLALTARASATVVAPDSLVTFTVIVTNKGPDSATGVTLTDSLSGNVAYVSASTSRGTCSQSDGRISCNVGTLVGGASATLTITAPNSRTWNRRQFGQRRFREHGP